MSHGAHDDGGARRSRGPWAGRLARLGRTRIDEPSADEASRTSARARRPAGAGASPDTGWDVTARDRVDEPVERTPATPVRAQILAVLADPRVDHVTVDSCARLVARPRQDIETTLDAMVQAGELILAGGAIKQYRLPLEEKARLEAMFRATALELGEPGVLAEVSSSQLDEDDGDEPRLPVTAGLLSLFLPGTGQLLNGDVGRASLVFAVWSLAWITHLAPVWTFVCLYAGAEAFFTAKIRGMERRIAKDALPGDTNGARALPP
jgi:hypothetical protein